MDQIFTRMIFMVKNKKSEHHRWILLIQISAAIEFQVKLTILIFLPSLTKKGFSGLKQKKWTPHIFYIILHIQISLVQNFNSNWQFRFFGPNFPKKVFPVKNRKSKHHHEILHILISLGTKFQPILILLSFWTKFIQKKVLPVENRTSSPRTTSVCFFSSKC